MCTDIEWGKEHTLMHRLYKEDRWVGSYNNACIMLSYRAIKCNSRSFMKHRNYNLTLPVE